MQVRSRLIAAGAVTLIAGLVTTFPARVAYTWFAPPSVSLSGISGTVWHGRANQARANGVYLREVNWTFRPLSLFTGKMSYSVEASPVSGFIDTTLSVGFTGSVQFRDLRGSLALDSVAELAKVPGLSGNVSLEFERLVVENGLPVAADGAIEVANLTAPLVDRSPIGGYRAEFFTQNSGVVASVEDTDGVVDLAGSLTIAPDRTYQFIALLAPKSTTSEKLRRQMQFLGTANDRGQYELRLEGQL